MQSFNIIQSQSKPFWLQISWCFSIPMSGSPDSSSDFLIPEERSFLLPDSREAIATSSAASGKLAASSAASGKLATSKTSSLVQPELPLTNLPPLDSEWPPLDSDSDCDAETCNSLVVQCSDSDVFERLTWVHHQGDWRCVMSKHVEEIAMNLDLHETMDWLEY